MLNEIKIKIIEILNKNEGILLDDLFEMVNNKNQFQIDQFGYVINKLMEKKEIELVESKIYSYKYTVKLHNRIK